MQVNVRLFATLRQLAGWRERTFEVHEGANLGDLLTLITQAQPALNLTQRITYAAINEEYANTQSVFKNGDRVAIFPPVSGGSSRVFYAAQHPALSPPAVDEEFV